MIILGVLVAVSFSGYADFKKNTQDLPMSLLNVSLKCDSGELASTRPTALISLNPFVQPLPYRPNLVDWALFAVNAVSMHCHSDWGGAEGEEGPVISAFFFIMWRFIVQSQQLSGA